MWKHYQNNPAGRNVGDCAVRALSVALGIDWETAYCELASNAYYMADMPSSNAVIGAVLRQNGYYKSAIPDTCPDCYTIENFCREHPVGMYVLGTGSHVVAVKNGDYYDSWDSGGEIPIWYWERRDYDAI